jgi:hypothetical protein
VLDGQLARGDDALGLVADVEQDLVAVDLDDRAFDDVTIVEVLDRGVDGGEEVLRRPDVVDSDLRGLRDGGGVKERAPVAVKESGTTPSGRLSSRATGLSSKPVDEDQQQRAQAHV